jgi:acetyltransferase
MSVTVAAPRSPSGSEIVLDDVRRVAIRAIDPADADGLRAFYRTLSPRSRFARFLGFVTGISDATVRRFTKVDHAVSEGLVAVLHEQGPADGAIVGHLCLEPDGAGSNELAIAIADEIRGLGIGKAMVQRAVESAGRRGIHRLLDAGVESIEVELAA